ncbi:MAG: DUF4395 family protein, partial [Actinomycetota bacterium]|nr:DUF4395 family protein [Actinomycetota bacterium]
GGPPRPVEGAPKRLAQGIGLVLSSSAMVVGLAAGKRKAARALLSVLLGAAGLEAFAGICLACKAFPFLVRAGILPEAACAECNDLSIRRRRAEPATH